MGEQVTTGERHEETLEASTKGDMVHPVAWHEATDGRGYDWLEASADTDDTLGGIAGRWLGWNPTRVI